MRRWIDLVWVWVQTVANGVAGAVANGSELSRMVRTVAIGFGCRSSSRMVRSRHREWFRPPSRMVQTIVANGSDCRPSSRMVQTAVRRCEWFGAVANGSDHRPEWFRPSSRMVQSRREWFRPSRIVIGDYRSYRRRWGSPVTGFGSEATGFGFQKNKNWMMIF